VYVKKVFWDMKVALVHDYLVQYGGAERVLEIFTELFPQAPIFTLVYDPSQLYGAFLGKNIHTSFIQKIPFAKTKHRMFPHLMPMGVEDFDLSDYDLVLSSANSFSKGVITGPQTLHISYCHTPMRYAWDDCHRYLREFKYSGLVKKFIPFAVNYLRMWDKVSSDRPDFYIANSKCVSDRITKYYKKSSQVIYPPVNVESFKVRNEKEVEDYFLMLGRFLPYKHYDIVVKAFTQLPYKLKIVGSGPEDKYLRSLAKDSDNIEFLGRLSDNEAREVFEKSKAFVFPSEDDFGIVPVEAMSAGRPVIAFAGGGALESVVAGQTGVFFAEQTPDSVKEAINHFQTLKFDSQKIRKHAEKFSKERFKKELNDFIQAKLKARVN
jgi:glycosyltransferase involved in cell wall biosynthesis